MEHNLNTRYRLGHLMIEVKTPTIKSEEALDQVVEYLSLKFRVQIKCFHFHITQLNTVASTKRHKVRRLPFEICRAPIHILGHPNNEPLQQNLSHLFLNFGGPSIDVKKVADAIKQNWIQIRDNENYLNAHGKVFPFTITLKLMGMVTVREQQPAVSEYGMVPTHKDAIKTMLKRVKSETIKGNQSSCVICFEEFKGEKNAMVEMPCLHVFHEHCINEWLNNSHYCPICRFRMPTI